MSLALFVYQIAVISTLIITTVLGFFDISGAVEVEGFLRSFFCAAFPRSSSC